MGKSITFTTWNPASKCDGVSGNPMMICWIWGQSITLTELKKDHWYDWLPRFPLLLWRGFQKPLDNPNLDFTFEMWLVFLDFWIWGVVGASQVWPSNCDGFFENPMIRQRLHLAAANPWFEAPFQKELFMSLADIARKLSCQFRTQPGPQADHIMQIDMGSFIQLGCFLPGCNSKPYWTSSLAKFWNTWCSLQLKSV